MKGQKGKEKKPFERTSIKAKYNLRVRAFNRSRKIITVTDGFYGDRERKER